MAAPTMQAVGATASSAGGANVTVVAPAHQTDDILLLCVQNYSNANLTFNQNTAGYALLDWAGGTNRSCNVYWVRATSSSMTNPSVTCNTNHQICCIVNIRGCITTGNPWDVSANSDFATTTSWSWPAVTTTVADTLCVMVGGSTRDNTGGWMSAQANSNLSSITEDFDDSITTNAGGGLTIWHGTSASAQNIGTGTGTSAASYAGDTITISFIPPSGGGGTVLGGRSSLLGVGI